MSGSNYEGDMLWNILFTRLEEQQKKLEDTKGATSKADLANAIYAQSLEEYFLKIIKMSESDFDKHIAQRELRVRQLMEEFTTNLTKNIFSQDLPSIDDIGMLSILMEPNSKIVEKMSPEFAKTTITPESLERLFGLELLNRFDLFYVMFLQVLHQIPLHRLESITRRRFNSNVNWGIAIAILALHENLVKKKLTELSMNDEEKNITFTKGKEFSTLIDKLADKIKEIENREVGLTFYRTSSLREIRNRLEHEGHKFQVTDDEINNLLNDIEKFEAELFKEDTKDESDTRNKL
ncbi:MAG: hypothetical protein KGI19_07210 [Thaumarchaeota archaeon]|nr:hypothetical protein [Nitrososphaerota archaeon]